MQTLIAKKYLSYIKKYSGDFLNVDSLSKCIGIYPEVIMDQLSFFNPEIGFDENFNLKLIIEDIEGYVESEEEKHSSKKGEKNSKDKYVSVEEFIKLKMSIGGVIDDDKKLDIEELKELRKLTNKEIERRKN